MGLFSKIGRKIYEIFRRGNIDENFFEELEEAFLQGDIGVTTTTEIIEELKQDLYKAKINDTEKAKEILRNIMLSKIDFEIPEYDYPLVLMIVGVNGVGKTTAIGKLAKYFKQKGKSCVIAAADTFRAAAGEQAEVWAERAGVKIIRHNEGSDPAAVVFDAISSAKARSTDVLLIDTAGRLHNKKNLMAELEKINRVIDRDFPACDHRNYIVLDATTGQNAISQIEVFNETIDIDGIILTKMDGTAKGGVVFSISNEKEIPVLYIGTGETINDLQKFNAEEFINSLVY
jgi:fused signal recognition particle receptor